MKRKSKILLMLIVLAVAVKMIFIGSNTDESYGIELAWRLARGDKMLLEMWEPHQTSAVFGAFLVKLFWLFTGGSDTGLVLYMHVCGIGIQFAVSFFLYKVLRRVLPQEMESFAFAAGCVYALCYPKGVIAPEYSNLQNWFMTCAALCFVLFVHNYRKGDAEGGKWRKTELILLSGIFLSGAVMAYPSMVILYPVMIILLWHALKKDCLPAILLLTLPCVMFFCIFLLYLLSYMNPTQIQAGIGYVLSDGAHAKGPLANLGEILWYVGTLLVRTGVYYGAALSGMLLLKKGLLKGTGKRQIRLLACYAALLISFVVQIGYWLLRNEFVNQPMAELFFLNILAVALYVRRERGTVSGELIYLVVFSVTGLLAAILLSNFKFTELISYLSLGAIGGAGVLYQAGQVAFGEKELFRDIGQERISAVVLCAWILTLSFGRVWVTSQGGELHTTPFEIRNVQKSGPGIGILTNYMTGHRYNTIAGEWNELVQDGEAVLYVGPSSFYYMFGDVIISAPNTISTPVYNESILEYWEMHPERYPEVALVESCYGELVYPEDNFIITWLDTEYDASVIKDYEYVKLYRR